VKKKKPKEHPQLSHRGEAKELASAGSKRKLEQVVGHDGEPSPDGDSSTEKKRRKKNNLNPPGITDTIASAQ
jgi:hypothetical protein